MKSIIIAAAILASTAQAQTQGDAATCAALAKSIDWSLRSAALSNAQLLSAPARDINGLHQDILADLAAINANITLMSMNRCAPLREPVGVPGPYRGAAGKCAVALLKASSAPPTGQPAPECILSNWQRDPVQ